VFSLFPTLLELIKKRAAPYPCAITTINLSAADKSVIGSFAAENYLALLQDVKSTTEKTVIPKKSSKHRALSARSRQNSMKSMPCVEMLH
jgi:hypothetical protein